MRLDEAMWKRYNKNVTCDKETVPLSPSNPKINATFVDIYWPIFPNIVLALQRKHSS